MICTPVAQAVLLAVVFDVWRISRVGRAVVRVARPRERNVEVRMVTAVIEDKIMSVDVVLVLLDNNQYCACCCWYRKLYLEMEKNGSTALI